MPEVLLPSRLNPQNQARNFLPHCSPISQDPIDIHLIARYRETLVQAIPETGHNDAPPEETSARQGQFDLACPGSL